MHRFVLATLASVALSVVACGGGHPGWDPPPDPSSSAQVPSPAERGARFVDARGCAGCHQSAKASDGRLSGQSVAQPGSHAYGANLTPDRETGIGAWTDAQIARAIRRGIDDQGAALCATMPRFATMTDAEASDIIAYLRALPPVHREVPASACE